MEGRGSMLHERKGERTLFSCGYGNLAPDDFLKKLEDAGIQIVIDVRRHESRAWCWKYTIGGPMKRWLGGEGIEYCTWSRFANNFDTLAEYADWIQHEGDGIRSMWPFADCRWDDKSVCLICAEDDVFEKDGRTPRCHRWYVAKALLAELGEGWTIEHI